MSPLTISVILVEISTQRSAAWSHGVAPLRQKLCWNVVGLAAAWVLCCSRFRAERPQTVCSAGERLGLLVDLALIEGCHRPFSPVLFRGRVPMKQLAGG